MGMMYLDGKGVTQDYKAAAGWFRKAAEQGNVNAQNNLGHMYQQGYGVARDYIRAYLWFDISASQGVNIAKANLKNIKRRMNSADASKAQELARECVANKYQGC
jgi:hypothetical protein